MIKSMTGFGKTTVEVNNKKIIIEIKSLNSKQFDMNLRMPPLYREKEMEVRALVKEQLDRGKIDMIIYFDNAETGKNGSINRPVVIEYFHQLVEIQQFQTPGRASPRQRHPPPRPPHPGTGKPGASIRAATDCLYPPAVTGKNQ